MNNEGANRALPWFRWLLVTAAIFLCYVFSAGPLLKMNANGMVSDSFVAALYAPLGFAYHSSPLAEKFFHWYLGVIWGLR